MLKNACPLAFGTLAHKTHINKTMSGAGTSIRPPPGTAWEGRIASKLHGPIRFPGPKSCENATRHAFRGPGPQSNRHAGRPRRQGDVEMPWAWGSVEKCTPACIFQKFRTKNARPLAFGAPPSAKIAQGFIHLHGARNACGRAYLSILDSFSASKCSLMGATVANHLD